MDQRGRQHPPHQQMEQCQFYRPAESRLRGGQSREAGERDRQAGLPCYDVHQVQPGKGRPYRYDTNPDNAQQVAPSNESRTQVAVNNEGKTNEATKNLNEPLQKGQTARKTITSNGSRKINKRTGKGMKI